MRRKAASLFFCFLVLVGAAVPLSAQTGSSSRDQLRLLQDRYHTLWFRSAGVSLERNQTYSDLLRAQSPPWWRPKDHQRIVSLTQKLGYLQGQANSIGSETQGLEQELAHVVAGADEAGVAEAIQIILETTGEASFRSLLADQLWSLRPKVRPDLGKALAGTAPRLMDGKPAELDVMTFVKFAAVDAETRSRARALLGLPDVKPQVDMLDEILENSQAEASRLVAWLPGMLIADAGSQASPQMGDIVYRSMGPASIGPLAQQGHIAIYVGTYGNPDHPSSHKIIEMDGRTCVVTTLPQFWTSSPDLQGSYVSMASRLDAGKRRQILELAKRMVQSQPLYSLGPNWKEPQVPCFRCDGLVYWAYQEGAKTLLTNETNPNFWTITPQKIKGYYETRGDLRAFPKHLRPPGAQ